MAGSQDFARAFGDALRTFLIEKRITQSEAARRLRLSKKAGKARLSTYCHISKTGKRPKPNAELLYLVCAVLGFEFEYNGYKLSAATLDGRPRGMPEKEAKQLPLRFHGQFDLVDQSSTISVNIKRPLSRVELSVSLKAVS